MITCRGGKHIPCVMKLAHYLRYYEARHGTPLSPEMADREAAKEGFLIDHTGEAGPATRASRAISPNQRSRATGKP
jgi:hypothetical protein